MQTAASLPDYAPPSKVNFRRPESSIRALFSSLSYRRDITSEQKIGEDRYYLGGSQ
jgi:hypothetical protein